MGPVARHTGGALGIGRRAWIKLAVAAAVLVALYFVVTALYDAEGQVIQVGGGDGSATLVARVTPIAVNPAVGTASVRVTLASVGDRYVDHTGRLAQNTRVTVVTGTGVVEERYPAGTVPSAIGVDAGVDGDVSAYPFDDHAGVLVIVVDEYADNGDGSIRSVAAMPVVITAGGGVGGWTTTLTAPRTPEQEAAVALAFARAFSTRAFAILVLGMSVLLAALSVTIGLLAWTRKRAVEATLMSWSAALLFALPALRAFMPGGPPIGVAVDVYVFLWVMVAAVCGAALLALAWIDRPR